MSLRRSALGLTSLVLGGLLLRATPGCTSETEGLGPPEDAGTETGEGGTCSFTSSFVSPVDGARLTAADDTSGKKCADGLVTTVRVATSAPDGTAAKLLANDAQVATATVSGAQVVFTNVSLPSKGDVALRVQIGTEPTCVASSRVKIDCGVPSCTIAAPKGPYLNGRPAAEGGDRVSGPGEPFATKVEVTTDVEDGGAVTLSVDGREPLKATAAGGKATFPSVPLAPDGVHTLAASCANLAGNAGGSGVIEYTVLTAPVDLTVTSPTDAKAFGVADDIDPSVPGVQFKVCGTTTTTAAIDVPPDAKLGQKNYCASVSGGSDVCVPMTGTGACVDVSCPDGGAPFDVNVTLSDKAGNQIKVKRTGLRCESKLPSVQIVAPKKYDAADSSTILNLSRGDTGTVAGALKKTVVACTDKEGAKAQLYVGLAGGTLAATGAPVTVVAATSGDGCPTGYGYVAKFAGVTLPESVETKDGAGKLVTATQLRVDVTDVGGNLGKSPNLDLWVDSIPPSLSMTAPACGKTYPGTSDVTDTVSVLTDTLPFTLKVTGTSKTGTYPVSAFDATPTALPARATISSVALYVGDSKLSLTATDAAGNSVDALPSCSVYVGDPPVLAITSPSDGQLFKRDSNVDPTTGKYKTNVTGTVSGTTTATSVKLKIAGKDAGTTTISSGAFTFSGVLLDELDALPVSVELVDSKYGTIAKSVTVVVDTHVPTMSGSLIAAADPSKRRAGGVDLSWTAGSDHDPLTGGSRGCDRYEVRTSASSITDSNWASATVVSSVVPGSALSAKGKNPRIPSKMFYAVRCMDKAGNASAVVTHASAVSTDFLEATLSGPTSSNFGWASAAGDFDKDGIPDLAVGDGNGRVSVYLGKKPTSSTDPGFSSTPTIVFTGGGTVGRALAALDFDGDGHTDLLIGESGSNRAFVVSGKAVVASALPVALATLGTDALQIVGDSTVTVLGTGVASAGNFDGDTLGRADAVLRGRFPTNFGVVVVTGRAIDGSTITVPAGAGMKIVSDQAPPSLLGFSVAAQDLDGDGRSDLVLGDHPMDKVHVFAGRALVTPVSASQATATATLTGTTGEFFGHSLSLPGAIDGTTVDLVIGASRADTNTPGRVYLASGTGASFAISSSYGGKDIYDRLGSVTLTVQPGRIFDADGDGKADVLACSHPSSGLPGACWLHYGSSLPPSPGWTASNAARSFRIDPMSTSSGSATLLGDVDGDGFVDFVLCSPSPTVAACTVIR